MSNPSRSFRAAALLLLAGASGQGLPGQAGFSWPTANASAVLLLGEPDLGFAGVGEPTFYTLIFNASRELRLELTPMSGDVDLYASATVVRPTAASYAAGNVSFASAQEGYSDEGIRIPARSLCTPACPSVLHVGVSAPPGHAAIYVLTATDVDTGAHSGGSVTTLPAGTPVAGSLRERARAHYVFMPPNSTADVVISLTVTTSGDPDLYVNPRASCISAPFQTSSISNLHTSPSLNAYHPFRSAQVRVRTRQLQTKKKPSG